MVDMIEVRQTAAFRSWLATLRDVQAKARIVVCIRRMTLGNLGDAKSVGAGIWEARIHYGPGYRLYFVRRGGELVILLCGGDKKSQQSDIETAKRLAEEA